jgi:hypothetical protein
MLQHELEMRDQLTASSRWNRGLMHVQRTGKTGLDLLEISSVMPLMGGGPLLHQGEQLGLPASDRGKHSSQHQAPL